MSKFPHRKKAFKGCPVFWVVKTGFILLRLLLKHNIADKACIYLPKGLQCPYAENNYDFNLKKHVFNSIFQYK